MKRRNFIFLFFSLILCVVVLFLLAWRVQKTPPDFNLAYGEQRIPIERSLEKTGETISVYFTSPGKGENDEPEIVSHLTYFLNSARKNIYGALYDLDYESVAELLVQKFKQGVDVKLVIERDHSQRVSVLKCREAGIPIVEDNNSALMHNKFFVVDGSWVWTGSTNITYNCLFLNNNNSVLIQSSRLSENYLCEFEEMFVNRQYGMKSPRNTKYMEIKCGNTTVVSNLFSPEDRVEQRVIKEIGKTKKSVRFMAFSFTSELIANELVQASRKGAIVQGVFEKRNAGNTASRDEYLKHFGIDVRWDSNPKTMHHKVMILDEEVVITGSYNFTGSAEKRNDENVIIICDAEIAREYTSEFYRIFEISIPVR